LARRDVPLHLGMGLAGDLAQLEHDLPESFFGDIRPGLDQIPLPEMKLLLDGAALEEKLPAEFVEVDLPEKEANMIHP
jgi:hypothetical protein